MAASTATARDKFWPIWVAYCTTLGLDAFLPNIRDPIPYLKVFAHRYRTGLYAARGKPVGSKQVPEAVRAVAAVFTCLGKVDPRLNRFGLIDTRLSALYQAYTKLDPPPRRLKPIPLPLLHETHRIARRTGDALSLATADMAYLGFFFLLRPGEYCRADESPPFRLCDVELRIRNQALDIMTCSFATLDRATFAELSFTTQKNMIRGEKLGHGRSGHSIACPVATIIRRIQHLRSHGASPTTPLYRVYGPDTPTDVTAAILTAALRVAAAATQSVYGFAPADVNARALRAGGAMALLCARVDTNIIKMVARWRSDAMFRYLHLQAYPLMRSLAPSMLQAGSFTIAPDQQLPANAVVLLASVPEDATALPADLS